MYRFLTQKILTLCELTIELIIQIVTVCDYHYSWAIQRFLQKVRIKDHRQRFSAALCMPEYATLTVGNCSVLCRFDSLSDCEILVIASQNLKLLQSLIREADKIFDDVQQTLFFKHSLKECIKLSILRIFITAVFGFPFHEAIFTGSDGSGLAGQMIADDADAVIDKHRRDFLHIVSDLQIALGRIGLLTRGRFQLYKYNRKAIQENKYIRALITVFNESPLVCYNKGVILRIFIVDNKDEAGALLALNEVPDFDPMLKIIHKEFILLDKLSIFKILQFEQCIRNGILRHSRIQSMQR